LVWKLKVIETPCEVIGKSLGYFSFFVIDE
jgi:hypothetical protein